MILNNSNSQQFNDIWSRLRSGFKLSHPQNSKVQYYEKRYTKNLSAFNRLLKNAIPYLYFILSEIERNGLPTELALIPGIESSYNPLVTRPTDAYAGMWQFEPGTGRRFNLLQNGDLDERRDIVKSTRSALNYLNYLHLMFHQWDIAIGAYNWGEGGMYRAILDSGMQLGKVSYTDLELRQITADYVPKIIALASIIENPEKFGVKLESAPNQPYFAILNLGTNTKLSDVNKLSSIDQQTFAQLNPQYKNPDYSLNTKNNILLPQINQTIYYASIGHATGVSNGMQLANNSTDGTIANSMQPATLVTASSEDLPSTTNDDDLIAGFADTVTSESSITTPDAQNNQELDNLLAQLDHNTISPH